MKPTTVKAQMVDGPEGVEQYLAQQIKAFAEINMLKITTVAGKPVPRAVATPLVGKDGRPAMQMDMVPVFLVVVIGRKR